MSNTVSNRMPWLLGLVGVFFLAKELVGNITENYENKIGVTINGFRAKWKVTSPLKVLLEIDMDIRNDNLIGGKVLGFDGFITWGRDGSKIGALTVAPFDLLANGHVNKSTWTIAINALSAAAPIIEQAQSGEWAQLPWMDGRLLTSYGSVTLKDPILKLPA